MNKTFLDASVFSPVTNPVAAYLGKVFIQTG